MTTARRAVVTGGGQGLGKATARALIADGFATTIVDVDATLAAETAREIGADHAVVDVTDAGAVAEFGAGLERVDALVNNAGIWRLQELASMNLDDQQQVLDVNVMGIVHVTRALTPALQAAPAPAIVNLSSGAAAIHAPRLGLYPASKAAVESLTRQWAMELAPVRVNAVGPGMIVTEGTAANYEGEAGVQRARAVPVGRVGAPDDIADVIAFLVSDKARYVSGQIIYVDGGLSAGAAGR